MREFVVAFKLMVVLCAVSAFVWPIGASMHSANKTADETWSFTLSDAEGKSHSQIEWKDSKAVVLLFIGADCPISNAYAPEINRVVTAYSGKQVRFYLIHSDPDITGEQARKHAADYGYRFTVLLDPKQVLAKKYGVSITPTSVLLNPEGEMLYRGRIDNRYIDLGQQRETVTEHDLRDAIGAILAGKPVAERVTKPVGCFLPPAAH